MEKSTPATAIPRREITIAQDAQTVTLTQVGLIIGRPGVPPPTGDEYQYSTTYDCDGTEHPTPRPAPNSPILPALPRGVEMSIPTDSTYRAIWTRDQLVIMTRTPTRTQRMALSLDADGMLVVDSITLSDPMPNDPTQPAPVPARRVYRKTS